MADLALSVITYLLQLLHFPLPIPRDSGNAIVLINTLTALLANQNRLSDLTVNPNPVLNAEPNYYDFIVVGGGTAGAIVANRLSANPNFSVLLLEAGGDPTILNSIPGLTPLNLHQKDTDWSYSAIPSNNYGHAMESNVARITRFKGLGGCSSHNWMVYNRGHPKDFENWAKLTGDESWNYENALKYFKKFENYAGKFPSDKYHGQNGPFHISNDFGFPPSLEPWNKAAAEMGYKIGTDFNGRQMQSFGISDLKTTADGRRMDTYTGYIKPILHRPNFKAIRYAHVHKVILDESKRATGVIYKRNGELIEVRANKEIILSAGALNSPQLLMLSGIGPQEHLKSVGVEPRVDLPGVGDRLEDHPLAMVGPFLLDDPVSFMPGRDMKMEDAEEYTKSGTGYFATNAIGGLGFISSSVTEDKDWSDVQVFQFHVGVDPMTPYLLNTCFGLKAGLLESWLEPFMGRDANFGATNVGRSKSTGKIRLFSNNPEDQPLIDTNYYDHPDDIQAQIDGIKFLVNMYENTTAWGKYGARLAPAPFPGCENLEFKSEAYWECIARQATTTLFHHSGTCKMGKENDPKAVVDSQLRVLKVKGLRVIDASIMPKITNANINTPTLMIGEKGADMILNDYADTKIEREELFLKVKGLRVIDASIMPKSTNANINTLTLMIGEKGADMILNDYAHTILLPEI